MEVAIEERKSEREVRGKQRGRWNFFRSSLSPPPPKDTLLEGESRMSFSRRSAFFASKASLALLGPLDAPPTARPKRSGRRKEPRAPLPSLENEPEAGGGEEKREKEGESKEERSRSEKRKKKLFIPLSSPPPVSLFRPAPRVSGSGTRPSRGSRGRTKASGTGSEEREEENKRTPRLRRRTGAEVGERRGEREEKNSTRLHLTFLVFLLLLLLRVKPFFLPSYSLSLSLSLSLSRRGTPVELFSPYLLRPEKKPPLCSQGAGSQRGGSGTRRKKQVFWCFAFTVVHENDPFVFSFSLEAHTHTQNAVAPLSLPSLSYLFPPRA